MTDLLDLLTGTNLALSGGIALVLLVRLPAQRFFGPRTAYALWLIPLLTAAASMLPAGRAPVTIPSETLPSSISRVLPRVSDFTIGPWASAPDESGWPASVVLMTIWVAGVGICLGVLALRQHRFVTSLGPLRRAADAETAIWYSDAMAVGPALVGVFRPRIVLPADFASRFTPSEQRLVIAHELAHLRAGDAQTNAIVALFRSANWFNPLVHLASRLMRFDQELARDAGVLARQSKAKRTYAEAMLKTQRPLSALPLGCYWTMRGSHPLRKRIAMLQRRAPGHIRRLTGAAVAASLALISSYAAWAQLPPRSSAPGASTVGGQIEPTPAPNVLSAASGSLLDAVQASDIAAIGRLIDAGADLNAYRPRDGTPLVVAARRGNPTIVSLLLDHGADPNRAAPLDGNPLIMAAAHGHAPIVRLLLERGADVNGYVPGDETPLINASGNGHFGIVQYLVEHGADVNLAFEVPSGPGTVERRSPLGQAIRFGHRNVADYLRAAGAAP